MNRQQERFLKKDIKKTIKLKKSLNRKGSRSWYAEDLTRCLHKSLRHYEDVKDFCDNDPDAKVYGVYLRYEIGQNKRVKIGKGVVYLYNGRAICTRDHLSATENPLETEVFIPCVDEASALTLEDALHRYFGKREKVHASIVGAYNIVQTRWLKPTVNSEGSEGGTENFDFGDIWKERVGVFTSAVEEVCQQRNVNVENFALKARENSQVKGSDLLVEWLCMGNDLRDFFLLMKPRSGKNATMFFGIAKYIKVLKERNEFDKKLIIDFISLWPSAFEGAKKDIKDYFYIEDVIIAGVDTSEEDWKDKLENLLQDTNIDAVFRFASMQSIDMSVAEEYNDDEEREGAEITFESDKCDYFKNNPAGLCVIDESDHGMRTKRSQEALELFGYTRRIWMSGTDLYALRQEVRPGNHFLYDIFDEIKDIIAGNISMPRMRKHSLVANSLPLEDYDPKTMDEKELTRKLINVFATNLKGKWFYNRVLNRFVDRNGNVIKFEKSGEANRLWEMIYYWENDQGHRSPEDHDHIFSCMPTVASCLALYNHIKDGTFACDHEPLTANTFCSANRIEQQVNDAMKGKRTIFLTVGRMLRGAKAPWSAVVRFDAYSDFKVGLQLELRGQNTNKEWFDVYDANMFRSSKMQYELIRSRTNGGNIDATGKKLHSLIPMYRKGEFEVETTTWEDVTEDYFAGNVVEGMKRRSLLDRVGLVNAQDILSKVAKAKSERLTEKDDREGKEGTSNRSTPSSKGEKDELEELIKKGMTVSSMLPLLMELTNYEYTDLHELIDAIPNDIFESWLIDKCGVDISNSNMLLCKDLIKNMFLLEETNEQLIVVKKKGLNWSDLNNPSKSDVNVSSKLAKKMFDKIKNQVDLTNCKLADTSCGNAEIQVIGKEEYNISVENMFVADVSTLNINIAQTRLKIGTGYKYSKSKEGILEMTKILEKNKVDVEITNDPFKLGKGNSDQLYPILMHSSPQRIKKGGYRVCIDPPTWTSGTKQVTDSGRVNLLEFFTTEHNLLELDYSVNNDFPGIGSQFVSSVIQIGIPYNGKTKITTVNGDEFYVDLTGVKALPDSKSLNKEVFMLFVKMQQKEGEKFYFKYCNNKHCSTSDYVDEYSNDTPYEYVNTSSNHGKKYAHHSNNIATHFVHSAYMGSNFKFDYFLGSNVSVMSNARVWIHDELKNTTEEILASIFESSIFKETVYTYKFTQYNECAFLNNIAIPPLDRVWKDNDLKEWYLDEN